MSVRHSWISAVLVSGLALFFFGCNDASDVGLGVGPDSLQGGEPVTIDAVPELDTTRLAPETGRDVAPSLTGETSPWRFLVGRVDDPLPGTGVITADGYFDVSPPSSLPDRISNETDPDSITAELVLRPDYVHGDTATGVNIEVQELEKDAEMAQARADTTFPAGALATDAPVSINPNDTLVTIPLSDAWLDANLTSLQNDSLDGFDGFKLTGPSEDAVVGFSSQSASLRLTHTGDSTTADYNSSKTFTHVDQSQSPASPPDEHLVLQDGLGTGLRMIWDFDTSPLDTLKTTPLNRAQIFVPVDTTSMTDNAGPPTFTRPRPNGFRMIATREDAADTPPCSAIRAPGVSQDGRECLLPLDPSAAPGAALVSNNIAFPIFELSFQRTRDDRPERRIFKNMRLFIADQENTAGNRQSTLQPGLPTTLPLLVALDGDVPGPPRATLTVTPL